MDRTGATLRILLGAYLLGSALAISVPAHAQRGQPAAADDERAPRDSQPEPTGEWYGWQTLSVDAAAFGLLFSGAASEDGSLALGIAGLGVYALGAPTVQLVHDNAWAGPSLGLRLGSLALMTLGFVVAVSGDCLTVFGEQPSRCATREAIGGALVIAGVATIPVAIVLDAVKARTKRNPERSSARLGLRGDPSMRSLSLMLAIDG